MVATKHSSACPLDCPDLCGLDVTVENGRVVKLDGDRRGPFTDGLICGKVRKFADHMYGDDRIEKPLIRTGPKGAPRWREATWDEALDVIVGRLTEIRERAGGEAIIPYNYSGSNGWLTEGGNATRFFRRLGASNLLHTFCASATTAAARGLYGAMPGVALEDYDNAKLIVLWGVNPSATGIHLVPVIERARDTGTKIIVVDPRETPLAKRADLHLPVRPGGDLPLALAIGNALIARGAVDHAFIDRHVAEFDEYAKRAGAWTIDKAAAETGVAASAIEHFVELYASTSPAVIRAGWGMERNRNGGAAVAAVLALPAIANKFGVRGGGYTMSNGDARWTISGETGVGAPAPNVRSINMSEIGVALRDVTGPRLEAVFVYNCNPVATAPDQQLVIEQLSRDDVFVVVHEQVMTDTAALADVVLPATTFLEHRDLKRGYGHMRLFDSPAVVAPVGESRSNNELFGALLERMHLGQPGDATTDQAIVDRILDASPHADRLRTELREHGVATPPEGGSNPLPFVDVFPSTVDHKVHLVPAHLDREADGLYRYRPDPGTAEFPLALISPAMATQISSYFGQLRDTPAEIEIAPDDAAARGIANGDAVRAWNAHGEVHCIAKLEPTVRTGVVVMHKGYWRKHSANGYTANALIPPGLADLGGQAAFNDARIQLAKR